MKVAINNRGMRIFVLCNIGSFERDLEEFYYVLPLNPHLGYIFIILTNPSTRNLR